MERGRWSNTSRARHSWSVGADTVDGGPQEAFLEMSARCNLRCRMCAINFDTRYRPRSGRPPLFEPDLFDRLRPAFKTLLRAHLYGLGEPTLNPHLADYVRDLKEAGVEVWFTTNATLIDDARAEAFAAAGADRISISIDGATAQTYETIRRGARFTDLMRGLNALGAARRRHGERLRLAMNFVAMASNVHELPRMVDLCRTIGIEEINVEPLFFWGETSPDLGRHYQHESLAVSQDPQELLHQTAVRAADAGIYFNTRFLATQGSMDYRERVAAAPEVVDWTCSEPWTTIYVTTAGEVRPCCLNDESFGNLLERPFFDIWNGEPYAAFRHQHVEGREVPRGCASCLDNGRKRHSPYFESVEPVSYRPLESVLPPAPPEGAWRIDGPGPAVTVTDPLVVTGPIDGPEARSLAASLRLLVDRVPVARLDQALIDDDRFLLVVPVPYVSEGAHLVSLAQAENGEVPLPGWSRRVCHFWRPVTSPAVAITGWHLWLRRLLRRRVPRFEPAAARTVFLVRLERPVDEVRVTVDGAPSTACEWIVDRHGKSGRGGVVLELDGLAPGRHVVEVRPHRHRTTFFAVERFAVS